MLHIPPTSHEDDDPLYKLIMNLIGSTVLLVLVIFAIKNKVIYIPTRSGFITLEEDGAVIFYGITALFTAGFSLGYFHAIKYFIGNKDQSLVRESFYKNDSQYKR